MATLNTWDNKNKHVDESITQNQFLSSSKVIIYAAADEGETGVTKIGAFKKIGLIQGYTWSESKNVEMLFELGSELPYLVPGRTTGSLSLSRILLSGHDLVNVLHGTNADSANFIKSLKDISKPLNIMFAAFGNKNSKDSTQAIYSRIFAGCHITSRNESISAGQTVVAEGVNILYTDIISLENTSIVVD